MVSSSAGLDLILSETTGGALVLELVGELDLVSAPQLEAALRVLDEDLYASTVLDLSGLTFIDSTGLRAIIAADRAVRDQANILLIVRGPPAVQRMFELTGTDAELTWTG